MALTCLRRVWNCAGQFNRSSSGVLAGLLASSVVKRCLLLLLVACTCVKTQQQKDIPSHITAHCSCCCCRHTQAISAGDLPPLVQHQQSPGAEWCEFAPLSSDLRQQRQPQGWYMRPIVWFR
jgi:hypothetical protein